MRELDPSEIAFYPQVKAIVHAMAPLYGGYIGSVDVSFESSDLEPHFELYEQGDEYPGAVRVVFRLPGHSELAFVLFEGEGRWKHADRN